jgi:hypothetical protein
MENTAIILIGIILLLLTIAIGLLSLLIYKLYRESSLKKNQGLASDPGSILIDGKKPEFHPAIINRLSGLKIARRETSELVCRNHKNEAGEITCSICDHFFCNACIKPFKTMHFCKEHISLVLKNEWTEILSIKTSTTDPEEGVRLYQFKKDLFETENLPTYIETHYKINVDKDYIETYLVLYGIRENVQILREKTAQFI